MTAKPEYNWDMETIIDYVFRKEKSMDALDLWTKKNIRNYLGDSDEKNDKRYPPSMQKIRKLIREEDKKTKAMGGVIDWNYLLNHVDSEF